MSQAQQVVRRYLTVWTVGFFVLLSYWMVAEAACPGRQYADPVVPCMICAGYPLAFVEPVRALNRRIRR